MKNIPVKNYLIVCILAVVTVIVTFTLANYYKNRKEYENEQNFIFNFVSQLNISNIDNYLVEHPDAVIYLSNSSDESIIEFENNLKKMIIAMDCEKNLVYFDIKDLTIEKLNLLRNKLFNDLLKESDLIFPNVWVAENGKINKILYFTKTELRASDAALFIKNNVVVE